MSTQRSRSTRSTAIVAGGLLCAAVLGSAIGAPVSAGTTVPDDTTADGTAAAGDEGGVPSWCGPDEINLGFTDGFGGNSWRLVTTAAARDEASKCPSVVDVQYADGQGDTQKAISDIQSMVASGVDAIVVFPDAGEAILPALRSAYEQGVVTVPYRVTPGGTAGEDYDMFVGSNFVDAGVLWGEWILENLPDGGNVLMLSGPPGNSQGEDEAEGLASVLEPTGLYTMIGEQPFSPTNWDPAETQRVLTALIAEHPRDRRHRVRLRAVARRGAAGVREQRTVDPVDRHVRRQPARLLLRREQAEQPGLRAVHHLDPERPRPPGDPVGRRPGDRRRAAGGRDLPERAPSRTRSPASPTRSRASPTSPATSTSPPRCPARTRPHCSTRPPRSLPGGAADRRPGPTVTQAYPPPATPTMNELELAVEAQEEPVPTRQPRIVLSHISKRYGPVRALTDVSLEVAAGEVHALLGENGAGKSTLMNVASGTVAPDSGTIEVDGAQFERLTPTTAAQLGIAIVHQHPALLPDMTVAENVRVALPQVVSPAGRQSRAEIRRILDEVGFKPHLEDRVDSLVGRRQAPPRTRQGAGGQARRADPRRADCAARPGVGGDAVRARPSRRRRRVGGHLHHPPPGRGARRRRPRDDPARRRGPRREQRRRDQRRRAAPADHRPPPRIGLPPEGGHGRRPPAPVLEISDLEGGAFTGISLSARPGEIVGVAGIVGNGQSELLRALAGLERFTGTVTIAGTQYSAADLRAKSAYMPPDRHTEALMMSLTVRENAAVSALRRFTRGPFVSRKQEVDHVTRELSIAEHPDTRDSRRRSRRCPAATSRRS